jgi:hypothetical protein
MEVSSQLHAPAALPPGKEPLAPTWIGVWVDLRAGLDSVVERNIPSPCRDSKAQRYTTEISRLLTEKQGSYPCLILDHIM